MLAKLWIFALFRVVKLPFSVKKDFNSCEIVAIFFWLPSIKPTTYFESFFIYLNNVSICKVFLVHNLLTTKQSDFLKSFLTSQFLLKLDPRRV